MTAVNTSARHAARVDGLTRLQAEVDRVQQQVATTKKLSQPADDPVGFARATGLKRADSGAEVLKRAMDAGARRLTATDTALESIGNIVQRARELALQGNNATLGEGDRRILAAEVAELAERLFGGARAEVPAYAADAAGVVRWQGQGQAPKLAIGDALLPTGVEGPDAFGVTDAANGAEDLFATLTSLGTALTDADPPRRAATLANSITAIDGHVDRLAETRATVGARLARLDSEAYRLDRLTLAGKGDLSKLEDLDMVEGIARLQRLTTVLQAAQGSFVKVANLSLWDLLR